MRRLLLTISCMAIFLFGCSDDPSAFQDNQGKVIQFSKLRGKWIIINYWATWCHACIEEIPQFNVFYKKNKNKVIVFGVNYDLLSGNRLKKAIKKWNITYPVLTQDPSQRLHLKLPDVIPVTYIITPEGRLFKRLLGPQTEKTLATAISIYKPS